MKRSFRYLMLFNLVGLGSLLLFGGIVLGGNLLLGGQAGGQHVLSNLFVTYLNVWPIMTGCILGGFCMTIYSTYFNLALTMGSCRREFFWANQLNFLIYLAFLWLTQLVLDSFSAHFCWENMGLWGALSPSRNPALLPVFLLMMTGGCCLGLILTKKTWLGVALTILAMVLFLGVLMATLFISGSEQINNWGDLPWLIPVVCGVLALVFDGLLWHFSQKSVVR